LLEGSLLSDKGEAIMPSDKYTKLILTVIACGLLVLAVQNGMSQTNIQFAWNPPGLPIKESRVFKKIQLCDSRGCVEFFNVMLENLSGFCTHGIGDKPES
jgi:hypothetical protein